MLLHICSNIMKISLTVQSFRTDTIFILNVPNENNSVKMVGNGSCSRHIVHVLCRLLWFFFLHIV